MRVMFENPVFLLMLAINLLVGLRWLLTRLRRYYRQDANQGIVNDFVEKMAMNHLPHIYTALRIIGGALNVDIPEPPLIEFTKLNGHDKRYN